MADKQLGIRLPEELHRRIKTKVALQGTTITAALLKLLERWVEDDPSEPEPKGEV